MTNIDVPSALAYIHKLDLPLARSTVGAVKEEVIDLDTFKKKIVVVDSEVVSFVEGISAQRRQDITNATLLAQLAANKKVTDREEILTQYDSYFDVWKNVGQVLQDRGFSEYAEKADGPETHEAIIKVAAVLPGGAPIALAMVTQTLEATKSMDEDKPWITIFNCESRTAQAARFQISLTEQAADGQFMVTTMAFALISKQQ